MRKNISRIVAIVLCVMCTVMLTINVQAEDKVKSEEASLTLICENEKETYALYKVADFSETGEFVIQEPFSKYSIVIDGLDSEGWRALSETLAGYVQRDGIQYLNKKTVDNEKHIAWDNLQKGLYLLIGEQIKNDELICTPMPLLITVPNRTESGEWNLHPYVHPKYSKEDLSEKKEINKSVVKIWKDEDNKKERPSKITIQLLKDGQIYDTVELSEKNNWQYTWDKLALQSRWSVVEKNVPKNYTVTSTQDNNNFVVTNTYAKSKVDETTKDSANKKLPQTGQLWWPVPILVIGGIAMFTYGLKKYRR